MRGQDGDGERVMHDKPRTATGLQVSPEAGRDKDLPSQSLQGPRGPAGTLISDSESPELREEFAVVSRHPVCGNL